MAHFLHFQRVYRIKTKCYEIKIPYILPTLILTNLPMFSSCIWYYFSFTYCLLKFLSPKICYEVKTYVVKT